MSLLDSYPFFDNFILDSLVLFLGFAFVVFLFASIYFIGTILYAISRGLIDKLTKAKGVNKEQEAQVLFFGKEPKNPKHDE